MGEAKRVFGDRIDCAERATDAVLRADALIILTEWKEFQSPNFEQLSKALKNETNVRRPKPLRSGHRKPVRSRLRGYWSGA
jgi:UDP-glucose 6-dehydrogenase